MSSYKIEVVDSSPVSVIGEGPHWDIDRQSLYYIDIYGTNQSISRYDYNAEKTYNAKLPGYPVISFIIPVDGTKDEFLVGAEKKLIVIQWNGMSNEAKVVKTLAEVELDMPENRFNDAKCDPHGIFHGGTMRYGKHYKHSKVTFNFFMFDLCVLFHFAMCVIHGKHYIV